jgi:hypothetical protein
MALNNDGWVRRFLVADPQKHRRGFTVYKVVSIVNTHFHNYCNVEPTKICFNIGLPSLVTGSFNQSNGLEALQRF